jgi:uncharacterized damage-inducible protein DinB
MTGFDRHHAGRHNDERMVAMPGNVAPVANEREGLFAYLEQQRYVVRLTAHGLTDEQARLTPTVSTLSVGGLVKHLAAMEAAWMGTVLQRPRNASPDDYVDNFRMRADETLDDVLGRYADVANETNSVLSQFELDDPVPVPKGVPWFPDDVDAWSIRWVLLHLIQETARHAGHADMVREAIDGATAFPLMAAAEGWPATEWLQPWTKG